MDRFFKHFSIITLILSIVSVFGIDAATTANLYVNKEVHFQTMIGFGGGLMFNIFPYNHPLKDELYDSIFNNAQINIIRANNWYNPQTNSSVIDSNPVTEIPMIREINRKWPHVKTMIASWSPPPYLKSNNSLNGVGPNKSRATLKKNSDGTFMYKEYGEYWYQCIKNYRDSGVVIDWVSIQNEPDIHSDYEGCFLDSIESPELASYGKALQAAYDACKNKFDPPAQFIGPDCGSGDRTFGYTKSPDFNKNCIVAYAHHIYNNPTDALLEYTKNILNDKPRLQTEFLINENVRDWAGLTRTWFDHAQIILRMLNIEHVQMYNIFALAYKPASTHCFFSLDTLGGEGYEIRPTWYMFKHFSRSIHRGWHRVASETSDKAIKCTAFISTNEDSATVVLINTGTEPKSIYYELPEMTATMYQTTDSVKYTGTADLPSSETITLPVRSLTSIDFHLDKTTHTVKALHPVKTSAVSINTVLRLSNKKLVIDYSAPADPISITLFDIHGRKCADIRHVYKTGLSNGRVLVTSSLAPGVYTIRLSCSAKSINKRVTIP